MFKQLFLKNGQMILEGGMQEFLSTQNPNIEVNHATVPINSFLASSTYKYKYMKIGFRVCFEMKKDAK